MAVPRRDYTVDEVSVKRDAAYPARGRLITVLRGA